MDDIYLSALAEDLVPLANGAQLHTAERILEFVSEEYDVDLTLEQAAKIRELMDFLAY